MKVQKDYLSNRPQLGRVQMLWLIDNPLLNAPHKHCNLVTLHADNEDDKLKALFQETFLKDKDGSMKKKD
jgi:hypothetical protein